MDDLFLCAKICCDPWRSHSRQKIGSYKHFYLEERDIDRHRVETGWERGKERKGDWGEGKREGISCSL